MDLATALNHLEFYDKNYHVIRHGIKTKRIRNKDKEYIGNKNQRKCRFCGKKKEETTFRKVAHAIPELIGNKVLISFEECDQCNAIFSKLENDLANYLALERSTSGIKGKVGVPTYKNNKGLKIKHSKESDNRILVNDILNSGNVIEDDVDKSFTIKAERKPYTPIAVYKCFAKMALSIMPPDYLPYFKNTLDWIREENHSKYNQSNCIMFEQFISTSRPSDQIDVMVFLKKQESHEKIMFCVFFISIGYYCYQIYLPYATPYSIDDEKNLTEVNLTYKLFPCKHVFLLPESNITINQIDLSSSDQVKGQKIDITYTYDKKEVITDTEIMSKFN